MGVNFFKNISLVESNKKEDDINSLITLDLHKHDILNNWNRYNGINIEVCGFLKSTHELGIYPSIYEGYSYGSGGYREADISLRFEARKSPHRIINIGDCCVYFTSTHSVETIEEYLENQYFVKIIGNLTWDTNGFVIECHKIERIGYENYSEQMNEELWEYKQAKIDEYTLSPPDILIKETIRIHEDVYNENITYEEAKGWVNRSKIEHYVNEEMFEIK